MPAPGPIDSGSVTKNWDARLTDKATPGTVTDQEMREVVSLETKRGYKPEALSQAYSLLHRASKELREAVPPPSKDGPPSLLPRGDSRHVTAAEYKHLKQNLRAAERLVTSFEKLDPDVRRQRAEERRHPPEPPRLIQKR